MAHILWKQQLCVSSSDEEAEKKRKRAAQLADFDMLGSEQLAAAQPKLKAHKVLYSPHNY